MIRIVSASALRYPTACRLQHEAPAYAESRQHVDQGTRAEQIDASTPQIADTWRSDLQQPGCLNLSQFSGGECLLDLKQQVCTDQQVLRFFRGKPEIPEYVAARSCDLQMS